MEWDCGLGVVTENRGGGGVVFRGKTIIIEVGFFFCGVVGVAGGVGGGVGGVGVGGGAAVHRRSKLLKMTEEI